LEFVVDELGKQNLPQGAICFEITETAAISNLSRVIHFMQSLKKLGCMFSLDDFGSGLSSFTYLKNLPVDFLKIDGQFIRNIVDDSVDESMVRAINQVGRAMGIETIAERVETRQVLDKLSDLGVEFAQGYFIARPSSVQTFAPWAERAARGASSLLACGRKAAAARRPQQPPASCSSRRGAARGGSRHEAGLPGARRGSRPPRGIPGALPVDSFPPQPL